MSILLSEKETKAIIFKVEEQLEKTANFPSRYNAMEFVTFGRDTLCELRKAQLKKVVEEAKKWSVLIDGNVCDVIEPHKEFWHALLKEVE